VDWNDFLSGISNLVTPGVAIAQAVEGPTTPIGTSGAVLVTSTGQIIPASTLAGAPNITTILIFALIGLGIFFAVKH
jgi:hypothetical protein